MSRPRLLRGAIPQAWLDESAQRQRERTARAVKDLATVLKRGDRICYTAAFVAQVQGDREMANRQGIFLSLRERSGPWDKEITHAFVRWDDEDLSDHAGDPEYLAAVKEHGQLVSLSCICKPGSARFGDKHA